MGDDTVSIIEDTLNFNSSSDATAVYTLSNALVGGVKYEVSLDLDLIEDNILNFQVGPGPTGTHSHKLH